MDRLSNPRVPITCSQTHCAAVLHVEARHVDNLSGTWRCLDHQEVTA